VDDRELYPPQDLIKWTDAKNRKERWAQGENTMRFRKETIEWKDAWTNLSKKEQVVVSRLRRGTHEQHRHVIEKMPSKCLFCGVSFTTGHILWECTETTREREREKRETVTTKEVWTDGTERLKRLNEYTNKIGLFHGIWTKTTSRRSRTNHKKLQREEYKWTRMLNKKEKKKIRMKCILLKKEM
jgi:hypothetical protein